MARRGSESVARVPLAVPLQVPVLANKADSLRLGGPRRLTRAGSGCPGAAAAAAAGSGARRREGPFKLINAPSLKHAHCRR
jgi:hypothetical protein